MLTATAEANNLATLIVCTEDYKRTMEVICGGDQKYVTPRDLDAQHEALKDVARKKFEKTRKMGSEEFCGRYLDQLMSSLDNIYESYRKQNEAKNIFTALRTPACIFSAMFGTYVASGFFSLFGVYPLANIFTLILGEPQKKNFRVDASRNILLKNTNSRSKYIPMEKEFP